MHRKPPIHPTPTEHDARQALGDHAVERAMSARLKYGPRIDADAIVKMLDDRSVVRYPTGLRFDAEGLLPGEFAHAGPLGATPAEGFCLFVHPCYQDRAGAWPLLIAYHIPAINYGEVVAAGDCERFGAALLGMDQDEYYTALCELAESLPAPAMGGTA